MSVRKIAAQAASRQFMQAVEGRFPVTRIMLFGSYARDSAGIASDVDLAVFLSGLPASFIETKLALADVAYDVLLETGMHIQPFPIWEEQWKHPDAHANPRLLRNIERDGVLI